MLHTVDLSTITADDIDIIMKDMQQENEIDEAHLAIYCEYAYQLFLMKSISAKTYFDLLKGFMNEKIYSKLNNVTSIHSMQNIQNRYFKTKILVMELQYSEPIKKNGSTTVNVLRKYNGFDEYLTYTFTMNEFQKLLITDVKRK